MSSPSPQPPPPPQADSPLKPGTTIAGRYQLLQRLGKGGFGEVWKTADQRLRRFVAIKFLLGKHKDDRDTRRRFEAEAVLATRITHASLVHLHDTGETEDGTLYQVMEFLDGESLHDRIQPTPEARIKLEWPLAVDIGMQVANVLAPLHEKGIIHRDLKPLNLMLVQEKGLPHGVRVKLLDFGIAKLTDRDAITALDLEVHTTKGAHPGSPQVMAPEQWRTGAEQGPEIDVYALGVILHRLLSGLWLFRGNLRVGHEILEPPLLTEENPAVPAELAAFVHRMLAKDRSARPTMAEVRDELARLLGVKTAVAGEVVIRSTTEMSALGVGLSSGTGKTADAPIAVADGQSSAKNGQQVPAPTAPSKRRRARALFAAGFGVFLAFSLGALALRHATAPPHATVGAAAPVASPAAPAPAPVVPKPAVAAPEAAKPVLPSAHGDSNPAPTKPKKSRKRYAPPTVQ